MMLRAFTTIIIGFTVSAIIVIVITFLGYRADNQQVTDRIKQDLSTGTVSMPPTFNVDTQTGIDTWTDCLTLMIATSGYSDVANVLTSAYFFGWKENHPCENLLTKIGPLKPTDTGDYWRYWWGSASVLKIILNIDEISLLSYQISLKLGTSGRSPTKRFVEDQAAMPSSWKTPCMAV
jgi:hypothetical protein